MTAKIKKNWIPKCFKWQNQKTFRPLTDFESYFILFLICYPTDFVVVCDCPHLFCVVSARICLLIIMLLF